MGTKNISLPRELEKYIDAKVASGEYAHASEVVRDGVRLLMRQEAEKLEWLREAVGKGIADADARRLTPGARAFKEARTRGLGRLRTRANTA